MCTPYVTFTKRKISKLTTGDYNLKHLVIPFLFHLLALVLCIVGMETSDTIVGMWILFVGFGIIRATPYFFEFNERVFIYNLYFEFTVRPLRKMIEICFPFEVHGVGLASIDLLGGFVNFLGAPILSHLETSGTFTALRLSLWISGAIGALVSYIKSKIIYLYYTLIVSFVRE